MCFFFFSSRRRHTRSLCDWSSDVCSSDLRWWAGWSPRVHCSVPARTSRTSCRTSRRSEERRVGKECRSRWWTYDQKKKTGLNIPAGGSLDQWRTPPAGVFSKEQMLCVLFFFKQKTAYEITV